MQLVNTDVAENKENKVANTSCQSYGSLLLNVIDSVLAGDN